MKLVSVPFDAGSLGKNIGCKEAPERILKGKQFKTLEINNDNIIETNKILEHAKGDFFVGGDHSITYSLFKGFVKGKDKSKIGLVVFDAHPDAVNNFSPPTHEDYLRVLIEEKIIHPENVLIIGLRAIDEIEQAFLDEYDIRYILMKNIGEEISYNDLIKRIKKFVRKLDSWYLSIDIDVLNPNEAPGTGYVEKGGMKFRDLKHILTNILFSKNLGRIDLVEVNPSKDIDDITVNNSREILNLILKTQNS
jgi:agmatinase